ncbi:anti-sigma factor, partial [Bacillus sp. JJ1474]
MDKKLEQLKKEYKHIPIPDELDFVVERALKNGKKTKSGLKWIVGTAVAATLFIGGLNLSPAMASTLAELPGVGNIVKVLTFTEFKVDRDQYQADIKVPAVTDEENGDLAQSLNDKYLQEGKELYEQFTADVEDLEKNGGGRLGVDSGYEVKTDNDQILSIARYVVNTVGSSSTVMKYDTIDKKNKILLSLPILFKDNGYIERISEN